MIRKFISYYKPHKGLFFLDLFCALLVSVCDLFYPMITRNILNEYIPNKALRSVVLWAVILIGIYLVKLVLNYIINYYGHIVGVRMQADMRRDMFTKLQGLPFSYFDNNKTGELMSRIINDLMDISELAHHGPEDLFISGIMIVGSFVLMSRINLPLTVIIFAFLPILVVITALKRKKMLTAFTETRVKTADINAAIENSISGVRVTKAFTNTKTEMKRFDENNERFKIARNHAYKKMSEYHSIMDFSVDAMNAVVLVLGGIFVLRGDITVGDFTAYMLFVNLVLAPIRRLVQFVEQYQTGMTGFMRFTEIMSQDEEKQAENAVDIGTARGELEFKNVSFTYDETSEILSDINLKIERGRTVALVGPSGGGKTTLCNLIPRFYDISSGEIYLDSVDIRGITLSSLRSNIGIVSQDTFLFAGSVRENIAYGNQNASEQEIVQAAKRANIYDFVMSLENGFDTYVGERGTKLSGGQKQRIAIARVFLKNPPIIILDEATSALDNTTEQLIQQSLEELCKDKTTLVVAHRLSTIKNADEIVVVTSEGIRERGTHKELLAAGGMYAGLYNSQFSAAPVTQL